MGRFPRLILYFTVEFGVFLSNNSFLLISHVESVGGLALIVLGQKTSKWFAWVNIIIHLTYQCEIYQETLEWLSGYYETPPNSQQ